MPHICKHNGRRHNTSHTLRLQYDIPISCPEIYDALAYYYTKQPRQRRMTNTNIQRTWRYHEGVGKSHVPRAPHTLTGVSMCESKHIVYVATHVRLSGMVRPTTDVTDDTESMRLHVICIQWHNAPISTKRCFQMRFPVSISSTSSIRDPK